MTRSTKTTIRIGSNFEIMSLSWSPLTESNRRPSPYHGRLASSATWHFVPDQGRRELALAVRGCDRALASIVCHSICHST
jgi:hypothetical protein